MRRLSRRQFLLSLGGLAGFSALGWWHETERVETTFTTIPIRGLEGPLRIVHLSDWHASNVVRDDFLRSAIHQAATLKPDLFCLTGDFTTHSAEYLPLVQELVVTLSRVAPVFACIGNHDGTYVAPLDVLRAATVKALAEGGAQLLYNESAIARTRAGIVRLAAPGDLWSGFFDPTKTLPPSLPSLPTILLCHNPDGAQGFADARWDLMLSGHTHGGQVNLPFMRGFFAPIGDKRFLAGLAKFDDQRQVFTTRGLGNLAGIRFRARPEISVLEFEPVA
jgi:hypothetical protein